MFVPKVNFRLFTRSFSLAKSNFTVLPPDFKPNKFKQNIGEATAILPNDLKSFFLHKHLQNQHLYADTVCFHTSTQIHPTFAVNGKSLYLLFFDSVRAMFNFWFKKIDINIIKIDQSFLQNHHLEQNNSAIIDDDGDFIIVNGKREKKTDLRLTIRFEFQGERRFGSEEAVVNEGVFVYSFDGDGKIINHVLESLDPMLEPHIFFGGEKYQGWLFGAKGGSPGTCTFK